MDHHQIHGQALAEGLLRHGVEVDFCPEEAVPAADVCACWGWRLGERLRDKGKRVLVMERGYVNRMEWVSLGWDGLNGRAVRRWDTLPDRWAMFSSHVRAWRPGGSYALLVGQVLGDMSVKHVDLSAWYAEAVRECA